MTYHLKLLMVAALSAAFSGTATAVATPDELKLLGTTFTPWGAEKAGNKEGTIPAYTGPIKPPASFDSKNPRHRPDPFASEKPLFSVDAKNMDKHADKLSDGVKAMLKKYPTYRLDVYASHRTASYPKLYLDNSIKNATQCKTSDKGLKLDGCWAGLPFPFPKTGNEVMWNRLFKFDGYSLFSKAAASVVVDTNGNITVAGVPDFWMYYPIFDPKKTTPVGPKEVYEKIRLDYVAPTRKVGEKIVVHDSVDMVDIGRRAWSYLPGQRRVKLSPDLAYDTPSPTGGGANTVDDSAVFYGALDRYDFKLVGKKELFIPYNDYKGRDHNVCPDKVVLTKLHLNPDCVRWELHRVWVVQATVKPGLRHSYPKRTFYWDEDLPGVGIADNYDSSGQLYRVSHSLPITLYETHGHSTDPWVSYDLATGVYTRQMVPTEVGGWVESPPMAESFFSSEAMAGGGVR